MRYGKPRGYVVDVPFFRIRSALGCASVFTNCETSGALRVLYSEQLCATSRLKEKTSNMSDHEYEEEVAGNAMGWAEIPSTTKALRACKRCSLVKGNDQFVQNGCENCHFLQMESDQARVQDCTTTYFSGLIGMIDPSESWVAKWQQIGGCRPGMYAIEVIGELPGEVLDFCEDKGIPYACKPPEGTR